MNAWRTQLVALMLAVGLGTVYALTLAPGAVWGDGLEFTTVVHVLGIPHPTGYPLYVMVGNLWEEILPFGTVAWRINLLSAVFGVAAALLLFGAVREAMPEDEEEWEDVPEPHHWRRVLIPAGTAMAWGLTPAVWQVANVAEVYTLFAVFLHALAWLTLKNMRRGSAWIDLLIAFVFGLALTHHRLIVVMVPAVLGYCVFRLRALRRAKSALEVGPFPPGKRRTSIALWALGCLVAFGLGLLPLLYLPLRAAANPAINWGDPSNWERFLWVIRGGEFTTTRLLATNGTPWVGDDIWPNLLGRLHLALALLLGQFVPMSTRSATFAILIGFTLVGLMALGWWRTRFALRWAIPITVVLNLAVVACYNIEDFQPYLLPTISAVWFWLALGVMWFSEAVEGLFLRRRFTYTALVLGLLPMWLGVRFWEICDRSHDERADLWAANVLSHLEPNALLITRQDGDTYALWQAQLVDGLRPDVTVFGSNFMWSGWYQKFFPPEEAANLHFEDLKQPPVPSYYLLALVTGVIAPNVESRRAVYTAFNPYESQGDMLVSLWPSLFGDLKYDIAFLGHTRDPDQAGSRVGPPNNPLLPPGYAELMRQLGAPAPQLYQIIDNPALTAAARQLFEEQVAKGYPAWMEEQRRNRFINLPLGRTEENSTE